MTNWEWYCKKFLDSRNKFPFDNQSTRYSNLEENKMPAIKDMTNQFKDVKFVQQYFQGCETGEDITRRLMQDGATLNSPELIATLLQALNDLEPLDENSDEFIQNSQAMAGFPSTTTEEDVKKEDNPDASESSDGTSREGQSSTAPTEINPFKTS